MITYVICTVLGYCESEWHPLGRISATSEADLRRQVVEKWPRESAREQLVACALTETPQVLALSRQETK